MASYIYTGYFALFGSFCVYFLEILIRKQSEIDIVTTILRLFTGTSGFF